MDIMESELYQQLDQLEEEFNVILRKDSDFSLNRLNSNSVTSINSVNSNASRKSEWEDYWAW
uniref:Uncharacterized protein LOC114344599 isoform X2 n=1 Tax=Diabrotica virgifera virgifera TaxID=50390 RepID=A0A6P7GNM1_DIAVI